MVALRLLLWGTAEFPIEFPTTACTVVGNDTEEKSAARWPLCVCTLLYTSLRVSQGFERFPAEQCPWEVRRPGVRGTARDDRG